MSLRSIDRIRKTIGFRLIFWYSGLFVFSSIILFGLLYYLVFTYLKRSDRDEIQTRTEEYANVYQSEGIEALKREILREQEVSRRNPFFARIAGERNNTLFLSIPASLMFLDVRHLEDQQLRTGEEWSILRVQDVRERMEMKSVSLVDGSFLQIGRSIKNRQALLNSLGNSFVMIMILGILLGLAGGSFLALRTLRPIRNLIQAVRSIEGGKMDARVPRGSARDELDDLIVLFNGMLGRIEALISGMRAALDNVAHDLRTPMARLQGIAEMALQSEGSPSDQREALIDCKEESERIVTMLNTLMDISEAETGVMKLHVQKVNISALIDSVTDLYRYVAEEKNIAVRVNAPQIFYLNVDRNRLQQVLANLLDNAVKYTPRDGEIAIEVHREGQHLFISIKDTGRGIPLQELPRIWDRLYRVDKSRSERGLGLGLSLVRAVVQAHKGSVEVSSELGKGSCFVVYLPADTPEPGIASSSQAG